MITEKQVVQYLKNKDKDTWFFNKICTRIFRF